LIFSEIMNCFLGQPRCSIRVKRQQSEQDLRRDRRRSYALHSAA
jgi:hypothetical protein